MSIPARRRRRSGFTLIEVLLVLVILVILGSLAVTAYGPMRKRAQIDAAKAAVSMFETPLEAYHLHMDAYPSNQEGLDALRAAPADAGSNWAGPYLKQDIPLDPWRNPYRYASPGTHNPDSYDLWSAGPDGVDGTADDIGNWASE
jgi:general secretion pathway protein G